MVKDTMPAPARAVVTIIEIVAEDIISHWLKARTQTSVLQVWRTRTGRVLILQDYLIFNLPISGRSEQGNSSKTYSLRVCQVGVAPTSCLTSQIYSLLASLLAY